jgi:hypothetical protein
MYAGIGRGWLHRCNNTSSGGREIKPQKVKGQVVKELYGYKIERGIPAPQKSGWQKEIMMAMRVGDSVLLPQAEAAKWGSRGIRHGIALVVRKVSDTHARCWRVAEAPRRGKRKDAK